MEHCAHNLAWSHQVLSCSSAPQQSGGENDLKEREGPFLKANASLRHQYCQVQA